MGGHIISLRQILEAQKSLRLHSLNKFAKVAVTDLAKIFAEAKAEDIATLAKEAIEIVDSLSIDQLSSECEDQATNSVLYYVAGFAAFSQRKSTACDACKSLLIASNDPPPAMSFENDDEDISEEERDIRAHLLDQVNRGKLCTPSDLLFLIAIYCYNFYKKIISDEEQRHKLLASPNCLSLFCQALCVQMERDDEASDIIGRLCEQGHTYKSLISRTAQCLFRVLVKNFISEKNMEIRAAKKRSKKSECDDPKTKSSNKRKVSKLQSSKPGL